MSLGQAVKHVKYLCCCLLCGTLCFAGDPENTALSQAHVRYGEKHYNAPPSVIEDGDLLFVIVEVDIEEKERPEVRMESMFAFRDAMRKHIAKRYVPPDKYDQPLMLSVYPELLPLLREVVPTLGTPLLQYNGPARVLLNQTRNGVCRYVVALPISALGATLTTHFKNIPSENDVECALQLLWEQNTRSGKLAALCDVLSLPEDRLRMANDELRHRINADSLCWGPISPYSLHAAERRFSALNERPVLDSMIAASGGTPAAASILAAWADVNNTPPWSALNARLLSLADEEARADVLNRLTKPVSDPDEKYAAWISTMAVRPWPELLREVTPGPVATASWRTMGHANFPNQAPDAETPEYREARRLFDKGQALPHLAGLLIRSVEASPRHGASWALLGDALGPVTK